MNQATQVLETRIQRKSGSSEIGKRLVNDVIKPDLASTVLILSNIPSEQEGYSNVFRGIMQTLRNSTHHSFASSFSRENAFAVCGYIDQLLKLIDKAAVKS